MFVEVRLRNATYFGNGAESVGWRKQQRLRRAARYYLARWPEAQLPDCRFDVLSLQRSNAPDMARWKVLWIRDAFS